MILKSKSQLRREYTIRRESMDEKEVKTLSDKIIGTIIKLPIFRESENIMLYLNFKNEINSIKMIEECYKKGKRVIIPYSDKKTNDIIPSELGNIEEEIDVRPNGYLQHKKENINEVPVDSIDLIIVPGIVFDKRCYRIGFGAGYYDKFLKRVDGKAPAVGVCYDYQIVENIPVKDYDIPLDYVVTEKRIIVKP